jgi:hypothetical protein
VCVFYLPCHLQTGHSTVRLLTVLRSQTHCQYASQDSHLEQQKLTFSFYEHKSRYVKSCPYKNGTNRVSAKLRLTGVFTLECKTVLPLYTLVKIKFLLAIS